MWLFFFTKYKEPKYSYKPRSENLSINHIFVKIKMGNKLKWWYGLKEVVRRWQMVGGGVVGDEGGKVFKWVGYELLKKDKPAW